MQIINEANIKNIILVCIFLAVSTFGVYSQVQNSDFINLDDTGYVTENLNIRDGFTLKSITWAFTSSYIKAWAPVTWLSFMLDYQLYGLNPKGYHLTNLFFHIVNALILFFVLLRMTGGLWQSCFVASLFALHPLNVDSVAWVAERKNVLSTFFLLLTLWAYIHYVDKPSAKRYSIVFIALALGLMTKSMLITLPFLLLLLDYWPLGRLRLGDAKTTVSNGHTKKITGYSYLILEKLPLLALTIGPIIAAITVRNELLMSLDSYPMQDRVINALVSYLLYLQKAIWPSGLSIFYAFPINDLSFWKGLICGLVLVSITVIFARWLHRAPYLLVGWFWFLGTLVPVIGIVQAGAHAMADRYAYIPLIGIFIIVAWGIPDVMKNWRHKEITLIFVATISISTLMVVTWKQVSHWKNSITIFEHAIEVTDKEYPGFAIVYNNLGIALPNQKSTEAILYFKKAIYFKPDYEEAHYNLGNALSRIGFRKEAISHYKTAIKIKPNFAKVYNNLGNALRANGEIEEAISNFRTAIEIKPDLFEAHYNLGSTFFAETKNKEAIFHFLKSIKYKPDLFQAHFDLGNAFLREGKTKNAIFHYRKAIKYNPEFEPARSNLKIVLQRYGESP
ncbi:MAG: tetratricopeptide repeat protein [Nitrospinae bacterium]|nr:tetratricopeptide repeat protein [Nitrospinota bacterium]